MNKDRRLCLLMALACFLAAFLLSMTALRCRDEAMAARISPSVIRFHVPANSNSCEDQEAKLAVKSALLRFLADKLPKGAGLSETKAYIGGHLDDIQAFADQFLENLGVPYGASVRLTECYFPTKAYGDLVFPSGRYEALQVTLGQGRGRNWWCVLYPALCFITPEEGRLPEASKEKLHALVPENDYESMTDTHRLIWSKERPRIRFWSAGLFNRS